MTEFKPGMRVRIADSPRHNDHFRGKEAIVQDPPYNAHGVCVKSDAGYVGAVLVEDVTLLDEPAFPVGVTVCDTKYGNYGTVTGHRRTNPANPDDMHMTTLVHFWDRANLNATTGFPNPELRLERVHILTHDELSVLDAGTVGVNQEASAILDRHLRPTVARQFVVTVLQPVDRPEITSEGIVATLRTGATLHDSAIVNVEEQKP